MVAFLRPKREWQWAQGGRFPQGCARRARAARRLQLEGCRGWASRGLRLRQKVSVWAFSEVVKQAGECLLQRGVSAGTGRVRKGGCDGRWVRPEGQQCGVTMEQGQVWPVVFLAS